MSTTAQNIIDAALSSSLWLDGGTTSVGNDTSGNVAALSRAVRSVYVLAAGIDRAHAYFVRSVDVTLGTPATTAVDWPASPEIVRILNAVDAGDDMVALVPISDARLGIAEIPPAVVSQDRTLFSVGRVGDPTAAAVLTLDVAYAPAPLTDAAHFIGATDPTDASTSSWPAAAGDPFLVAWLNRYFARKESRNEDLPVLDAEVQQAAGLLGDLLGVAAARLAAIQVET